MKNDYLAKQPLKQNDPMEDVVRNAVWLMSDYSEGVTGQILNGNHCVYDIFCSGWWFFYCVIYWSCLLN